MSLQEKFQTAAEQVKALPQRPSDNELLEIYALYKQATEGDNNTERPWSIQLTSVAKWNSWNDLKGMAKETAQQQYIDTVEKLKKKYQ